VVTVADPTDRTDRTDASELPTTYEAAREELVDVVRRLESGGATLEESLALWERGEAVATLCRQWLDGSREALDAAVAGSRGADQAPPG